ncbi:hypothetical protein [Nocardioides hankookensis]|uniref:Uncharacterized protein n=1 Tax=Nocardioides hankookensis TaxID=443157 RepID=A0ABW1LHK2_9ACTN
MIAAVAVALTVGLVSAPSTAGSPPDVRIRPADLARGAAPHAGWVEARARVLHTSDGHRVSLPDRIGEASDVFDVWRVEGGWLVDYDADEPGPDDTMAIVGDDGTVRDLGLGNPAIVARGGHWFVTKVTRLDADREKPYTELRQVRVADGRVLSERRIYHAPGRSYYVQQAADDRVLLQAEDAPSGGVGRYHYTSLVWIPSTDRLDVLWKRTQPSPDSAHPSPLPAGVASTAGRWISIREGRVRQAIRDLRTYRVRWSLPRTEYTLAASPDGAIVLTATDGRRTDVQALRARDARTGRLLSTYRVTTGWLHVEAWESPRTFVLKTANRLDGNGSSRGLAVVRCTAGTARCQRVKAPVGALFVHRPNS